MEEEIILKEIEKIQQGSVIYITRYKRKYKLVCVTQFHNDTAIEYSIPYRNREGFQTRKIRTNHISKALKILLKNGILQRGDLKENDCGEVCNFCVLGGILCLLHPKNFTKTHGKIIYMKK